MATTSVGWGYSRLIGAMMPFTGNEPDTTWTAFRTCPLCEAGSGLSITVLDEQVVRIRGEAEVLAL